MTSLYDDMKAAISVLEDVVKRERKENGPHTAISHTLDDIIFRAKHVRVEINWRANLEGRPHD